MVSKQLYDTIELQAELPCSQILNPFVIKIYYKCICPFLHIQVPDLIFSSKCTRPPDSCFFHRILSCRAEEGLSLSSTHVKVTGALSPFALGHPSLSYTQYNTHLIMVISALPSSCELCVLIA